jgi:hypothetical protein
VRAVRDRRATTASTTGRGVRVGALITRSVSALPGRPDLPDHPR